MLKFIGIGSAFNTKYVENSSFIKDGSSIFIIDCGCRVFHRIRELNLLSDVKNIYVALTHTHPDHVGSLGNLIFYTFYVLGIKTVVIFPDRELIINHLDSLGVTQEHYLLESGQNIYMRNILNGLGIEFVNYRHVVSIPGYHLILSFSNKKIFYSCDSNEILEEILQKLYNNEFDCFYQDTCSGDFPGNPHLYISKLERLIKPDIRSKVYCMHIDETFDIDYAYKLGFKVVNQI